MAASATRGLRLPSTSRASQTCPYRGYRSGWVGNSRFGIGIPGWAGSRPISSRLQISTHSASAFEEARAARALSIASCRLSGVCARHPNASRVTAINKMSCLFTNILPNRQSKIPARAGSRVGAHKRRSLLGKVRREGLWVRPGDRRRVMPALFDYLDRLEGDRWNENRGGPRSGKKLREPRAQDEGSPRIVHWSDLAIEQSGNITTGKSLAPCRNWGTTKDAVRGAFTITPAHYRQPPRPISAPP
jgi:hypothetical protein